MSTLKNAARATRAAGDAMTAAGLYSRTSGEMMLAAGEVISKRLALGTAALMNPAVADHAEFALMVPEKAEAFAAAGTVLTDRSLKAARYVAQVAASEASIAVRTATAVATCPDPARVIALQFDYTAAWMGRAMAHAMRLGAMTLQAQSAVLAPVHRTATANARRLRR